MTIYNKRKRKFALLLSFFLLRVGWLPSLFCRLWKMSISMSLFIFAQRIRSNEWSMNLKATFQHRTNYMEILLSQNLLISFRAKFFILQNWHIYLFSFLSHILMNWAHGSVLIEGVKYHADKPNMIGKTFLRLERDFDKHVIYCRDEPNAQEFLQDRKDVREYFQVSMKSANYALHWKYLND